MSGSGALATLRLRRITYQRVSVRLRVHLYSSLAEFDGLLCTGTVIGGTMTEPAGAVAVY